MMKRLLAVIVCVATGCGTILNSGPATIRPPEGATVDGHPGAISASKKHSHEVVYADGRRCLIESNVSAGYVLADLVFWFLLGVIVDGATDNWSTLDEEACPGVAVD